MNVGFIGLGTMGRHMASNLLKGGHKLVVYDVRREAAAPHLQAGATWATSPKAVAEASDVVFTSLPGPAEVEAVALDEQRRAHLHHDQSCLCQGQCGIGSAGVHVGENYTHSTRVAQGERSPYT